MSFADIDGGFLTFALLPFFAVIAMAMIYLIAQTISSVLLSAKKMLQGRR